MRKVLLVQNERYLDRALQDVGSLIAFEQQQIGKDEQVDLLAVILMSSPKTAQFTLENQTCELLRVADSTTLFTSDSVSVNGLWLLLTVRPPDVSEPVTRQESLSRVLSGIQEKECVQSACAIFSVFSSDEDERSVAEQMAYLQSEHRSLPINIALSIHCPEYRLTTSKFGSHSRTD